MYEDFGSTISNANSDQFESVWVTQIYKLMYAYEF